MASIRRLLEIMSLRERTLITAFVWVLLLWWFSNVLGEARAASREHDTARTTLQTHQFWFDEAANINARLAAAREGVDPANTYNAEQLAGRMDSLLRSLDLAH